MSPTTPEWGLTPRQQLGQQLRELREAADMLSMDVAKQIGVSADLASRLELGERWPKPEVVRAWARVTGHTDKSDDLVELLTELRQRESRLRSEAQRATLAQTLRSDMFRTASKIWTFAVTEVPFYLQTAEYARQEVGEAAGAADVVAVRRSNREAVGSSDKHFRIVLAESALRYFPCDPRAMRAQISELQGLVDAPGVEFGVIPLGRRIDTPMLSSFSVLGERVIVESFAGAVDLTPKSARRYIDLVDRLWAETVRGEVARELLTAAASALPAS